MIQLRSIQKALVLAGCLSTGVALAGVSAEDKARIGLEGTELTPAGAIRAGNAEGTIPAWTNEPIKPPASFQAGTYHVDPFAEDEVLFTITAQNFMEHADKLSEGQKHMFETYPDYFMNIYPTRRSAVFQPYIYEAALENLDRSELINADVNMGVVGFKGARKAWAFPIPQNGSEAWMNQATRPITPWLNSFETTLAVTTTGKYVVNKLNIQKREKWSDPDIADADFVPSEDAMFYYQTLLAPPKLAGQVVLARDPQSFDEKFRSAWAYSPGQRRVKRAPQIVYDNPLTASDGLATTDQKWGFNGPNDRFEWKLVGRKEMYVPYNAYKLHSADATPDKVILPNGRVNQDFARYELHRVWVIESVLKEGTNHDYGRRTFYLDEDSWWIMLVDGYDRRNQIWRYWESHDVMYYDVGFMNAAAEFQYDMQAGRMLALMWDKDNAPDFSWREGDSYFTPASVRRRGVR
ncbi:MAG TPA: DUF1329 domain-containing protein [Porticoccaceae bacterium]|nr:DUF1329 domain-containing protein [Porticoccaceae bacterium]